MCAHIAFMAAVTWQLRSRASLASMCCRVWLQDAKDGDDAKEPTAEEGPWLFTLDFPSYMPVQQHSKNRCTALRHRHCTQRFEPHLWFLFTAQDQN